LKKRTLTAITRAVSPGLADCELTFLQTILANRNWIDVQTLAGFDLIDVPEDEPWAANTLTIGDTVMTPSSFPKTRGLIEERGFKTLMIDVSELRKAEAGLTCLSLIFEGDD